MLFALLFACASEPTSAAGSAPLSFDARLEDRVLAADAVFEGVVKRVEYARSEAGEGLMRVPHTFVTWEVERSVKGDLPKELTLRFVGGRSEDGRILRVSDIPDFEVGDRDILLIDGAPSGCPLVGCGEGRFRVLGDRVTTEDGAVMVLSESGGIRPGSMVQSERLGRIKVGEVLIPVDRGEGGEVLEGVEVGVGMFREELGELVRITEDTDTLPIVSQDPGVAFTLPAPSLGGPGMPDMEAVHKAVPLVTLPPKK